MSHRIALALGVAFLGVLPASAGAVIATPARVDVFSPHGTVKKVRQVRARFSRPMVPFGDPTATRDPFERDCEAKGSSRWVDDHDWVFDFAADLPAGVRCTFTLRPGLRALSGASVGGARRFSFSTGGPAVRYVVPGGGRISEDQAFLLKLDAAAEPESIEQFVSFAESGLHDPIGVRIVEGAERDAMLAALDEKPGDPQNLVLAGRQRFAPDAKVVLRWGRGVRTRSGVATEAAQTFRFETRTPFTAGIRCERENARADCLPIAPLRVAFSAPVAWGRVKGLVLRDAAPGSSRAWNAERSDPTDGDPLVGSVEFAGPFPDRATLTLALPDGLTDDSGRVLTSPTALEVRTAPLPPLAKFAARFGILESKTGGVLPVTLRSVEAELRLRAGAIEGTRLDARHATLGANDAGQILLWLRALNRAQRDESVFADAALGAGVEPLTLPKIDGAKPLTVVGIPLGSPGLHVVEISSEILGRALLGEPRPLYAASGALVTNLGVHFKWGDESSLAFVTSLDAGLPVAGARVRVFDCADTELFEGATDADGLVAMAGLPARERARECTDRGYDGYDRGLLVVAESRDDLSFVHTSWNDGIEPWRFRLPTEWRPRPLVAHTILDRALLRAGDTLHMKHILRRPAQAGFASVPAADRPATARLVHLGSDERYDLPLAWGDDGSAVSDWTIPQQAKLGAYEVNLVTKTDDGERTEVSAGFRVEEFRVPLMKGAIQTPAEPLIGTRAVPLELAVRYLGGGGASGLPVKLRSQVRPRSTPLRFPDLDAYLFGRGAVREGTFTRGESEAEEGEAGDGGEPGARPAGAETPVATQDVTLDASGAARATVGEIPRLVTPMELLAELEFRDPSGEVQTASRTVPLWPDDELVGIDTTGGSFFRRGQPVPVRTAVVDVNGKPVWRARVRVDAYERRLYSTRKRLVGGFYAYEHVEEVRAAGTLCEGRTDRKGRFACAATPEATGNLVLVARTGDGDAGATQRELFVAGKEESWFAAGDGDRMDLVPDEARYEPGEEARIQVRMPFREATALVTVEREGVAERFVTRLSGRDPVVEVPIRAAYAPNVFVSVLVVRGRVGAPQPTALVDLAKPSYRLGVVELRVGWRANELRVEVEPEHDTYRVRARARVVLDVKTEDGEPPPAGSEVALAAVDEGLLELLPNASWRLLDAMMGRRSYGVATSTAQMQVVGKRHFGLKALPAGGGGGRTATRELFDTLLFWRARVPLDAKGRATVEIPLNDSLTAFRIAAVATGGESLFGTGEATIRTAQDLMVLPGLPPVVRQGDRTRAGFTVRNTTSRSRSVELIARAAGLDAELAPLFVELGAGESREVGWDVVVPATAESIAWQVDVLSKGEPADRLALPQKVLPAVPTRVLQATLGQLAPALRVPVARPAAALPGRGGVDVVLRARLADGLPGVERVMRTYPYTCLEQQTSVAIALGDRARWDAAMAGLPGYLDGEGFAKFYPGAIQGSDTLTSAIVSLADAAGWPIPSAPRDRMSGALERFASGALARSSPALAADLTLRKLAAIAALARIGAAGPELLASIPWEPDLWPTSSVLDAEDALRRLPGAPKRAERLRELDRIVRARADFAGTTLAFSTESRDTLDWLLASPDVNAARLVLARLDEPAWHADEPRLVRGLLARQRGGSWSTPTANAWATLALRGFSRVFEATPVSGRTEATLGGVEQVFAWTADAQEGSLRYPWPAAPYELALRHDGTGRPWAAIQSVAAVPLTAPLASGYRVAKRLEPVEQKTPGVFSVGDIVRVRLDLDAQADRAWVVVDDPIPPGASILGSGLGGDSRLATQGEEVSGCACEAFTERGQASFRRTWSWAPRGAWSLEYTLRLNQSGSFGLPPTRVEAMYAPESYGELPNPTFEVRP